MFNKVSIVFYVFLTLLAAALQVLPRIMGDAFVFAAILGGFPVYIAAKRHQILGIGVFIAVSFLTSIMGISEALFFICTNGIIGLSLGIMKYRFRSIYIPPVLSALIVVLMLSAVNHLFGISIFGQSPQRTPFIQALILFAPLYVYSLIYLRLAMSADKLLHKYIELGSN